MTTRELIEDVREQKPAIAKINGEIQHVVPAYDYDALRAATLAVLDEVIPNCAVCEGNGFVVIPSTSIMDDGWRKVACESCDNAHALRERLK